MGCGLEAHRIHGIGDIPLLCAGLDAFHSEVQICLDVGPGCLLHHLCGHIVAQPHPLLVFLQLCQLLPVSLSVPTPPVTLHSSTVAYLGLQGICDVVSGYSRVLRSVAYSVLQGICDMVSEVSSSTCSLPPRASRKALNRALALSRFATESCASERPNTRRHGSRNADFWSPKTRFETKMSFWNVCTMHGTGFRLAPLLHPAHYFLI